MLLTAQRHSPILHKKQFLAANSLNNSSRPSMLLLLTASLLCSPTVWAEKLQPKSKWYKWADQSTRTHYSQTPPVEAIYTAAHTPTMESMPSSADLTQNSDYADQPNTAPTSESIQQISDESLAQSIQPLEVQNEAHIDVQTDVQAEHVKHQPTAFEIMNNAQNIPISATVPENAKVIPNKYNYRATQYRVSAVEAATALSNAKKESNAK